MRASQEFPADASAVPQARHWASDLLSAHGYEQLVPDAGLCLSELAANAIDHAVSAFRVDLNDEGGRVHVGVHDDDQVVPHLRHPAPDQPDGRGLLLVAAVAAAWGIECEVGWGKSVWFELAL